MGHVSGRDGNTDSLERKHVVGRHDPSESRNDEKKKQEKKMSVDTKRWASKEAVSEVTSRLVYSAYLGHLTTRTIGPGTKEVI